MKFEDMGRGFKLAAMTPSQVAECQAMGWPVTATTATCYLAPAEALAWLGQHRARVEAGQDSASIKRGRYNAIGSVRRGIERVLASRQAELTEAAAARSGASAADDAEVLAPAPNEYPAGWLAHLAAHLEVGGVLTLAEWERREAYEAAGKLDAADVSWTSAGLLTVRGVVLDEAATTAAKMVEQLARATGVETDNHRLVFIFDRPTVRDEARQAVAAWQQATWPASGLPVCDVCGDEIEEDPHVNDAGETYHSGCCMTCSPY